MRFSWRTGDHYPQDFIRPDAVCQPLCDDSGILPISTLCSKSFQFQRRRDLPGSDLTALVNEGEHRAMVGNEGPLRHQRPQFSLDKAIA